MCIVWALFIIYIYIFQRRRQVRHDIGWFDKDESAVGILTSRLESEASTVRIQRTPSEYSLNNRKLPPP